MRKKENVYALMNNQCPSVYVTALTPKLGYFVGPKHSHETGPTRHAWFVKCNGKWVKLRNYKAKTIKI